MIKVNGRDVDLKEALPLTIGDLKKLKASGVDIMKWRPEAVPDDEALLMVEYVLKKVGVTQDEIDNSPMTAIRAWSDEIGKLMPGETADPSS